MQPLLRQLWSAGGWNGGCGARCASLQAIEVDQSVVADIISTHPNAVSRSSYGMGVGVADVAPDAFLRSDRKSAICVVQSGNQG